MLMTSGDSHGALVRGHIHLVQLQPELSGRHRCPPRARGVFFRASAANWSAGRTAMDASLAPLSPTSRLVHTATAMRYSLYDTYVGTTAVSYVKYES
eukprot:scaffold24742_cov123-Isochrysis_galbana.AAC.2